MPSLYARSECRHSDPDAEDHHLANCNRLYQMLRVLQTAVEQLPACQVSAAYLKFSHGVLTYPLEVNALWKGLLESTAKLELSQGDSGPVLSDARRTRQWALWATARKGCSAFKGGRVANSTISGSGRLPAAFQNLETKRKELPEAFGSDKHPAPSSSMLVPM